MWAQNSHPNKENFNIYVVRAIDDVITDTYITGIRDFVYVPVNEARRALNRLIGDHYIATDNQDIAKEYGLRIMKLQF